MQSKKIEIDVDVNREIEGKRTSFNQSPNEILREIFGLPTQKRITRRTGQGLAAERRGRRQSPITHRTGSYVVTLRGDRFVLGSLKEAYMTCLRKLGELDTQFFERLSRLSTKSRRIVSRDPHSLYLKTPELSDKFAVCLENGWWVDTNLSRIQCKSRLKMACDIINLQFGSDLILDFPDTKTPDTKTSLNGKVLLANAPIDGVDIARSRYLGREIGI